MILGTAWAGTTRRHKQLQNCKHEKILEWKSKREKIKSVESKWKKWKSKWKKWKSK